MTILIITQKVDVNDPILGFFHNWLREFSKHSDITVICLEKGFYDLPNNVNVISLGKEKPTALFGSEKASYIFNFYKAIFKYRNNYENIFVHMNQEYVILGGLFWKLIGKKIFLWRNHPYGNIFTKISIFLSDKVFCTSPQSFTAKYKKTSIMPVGIDTALFKRNDKINKIKNSILSLGRISPIKKTHDIINAFNKLDYSEKDYHLNIVGSALDSDTAYCNNIKNNIRKSKITWHDSCRNIESVNHYNENELFINLTPSGSLDKTILEAMSSECLVLTSNDYFKNILDSRFIVNKNDKIEYKIKEILSLSSKESADIARKFRNYVIKNHSLELLSLKVTNQIITT